MALAAGPAFAQGNPDTATGSGYDPNNPSGRVYNPGDYGRGEHNFGWVGIIGLAGLAGLMRRNRTDVIDRSDIHATRPRV